MPTADSMKSDKRSRRAWRLCAAVAIGALILGGRLFQLQILGAETYDERSRNNRVRAERVRAPRGLIVDREGVVLADSRPSFTVTVIPADALKNQRSQEYSKTRRLLSELRRIPEGDVTKWLESGSRHSSRVVRHDVGFAQVSYIAEHEDDYQGIALELTNVRSYPQGTLAAHMLGHVGEVSEEELKNLASAGYRQGDFIGRLGLEHQYEKLLRGQDGERYQKVDVLGRDLGPFPGLEPISPVAGNTLHLDLDSRIQAIAESLLVGRRGSICVMDVSSGGMLAMVSAPSFDPNLFATGIGADDWNRLNEDENVPMLNRTVQAIYAPGSTFKMVTFALVLENKVAGFRDFMDTPCLGGYHFGNRFFGCWEELGHGWLDLEGALVQSCDTYFYQIAEQVPADDLAHYAEGAGLGRDTGIDLPQEHEGNVPRSEWLDRRYGKGQWTQGTVLNLSIGQGEYLVTPIQMVRFAATIANDGQIIVPRLVRRVGGGDDAPRPPRFDGAWPISASTMRRIKRGMQLVVSDSTGTGRSCRVPGFTPAAKTGTAENPHGEPHSWFIGYAPAEDPEVAFCVVVEAGGHGSDTALPMARTILREFAARREGTT